jgi:hypothetical protein
VQSTGIFELTRPAGGAAAPDATFTGTLSASGKGTGTWTMASYNVSGTWEVVAAGR